MTKTITGALLAAMLAAGVAGCATTGQQAANDQDGAQAASASKEKRAPEGSFY